MSQSNTIAGRKGIAALVAAVLCLFCAKSGFFRIFFLVPLGFVFFKYNKWTAWMAFALAAVGNFFLTVGISLVFHLPASSAIVELIFFTVLCGIFTLINAPPEFCAKVPGVWRMAAGSCLFALAFIVLFFRSLEDPVFFEVIQSSIKAQMVALDSLYFANSPDVVRKALLDSITPEFVLEIIKSIVIRGGALVSSVFILWASREVSVLVSRLFRVPCRFPPLRDFHVHPRLIWVLSFSLLAVLLSSVFAFAPLEILLWNILVLCVILFLAQGLGILYYFASRMRPFARIALILVFVVLLFSPGINAVLLAVVILLGIAENWVSFRISEPSSTPGT